MEKSFKGHAIFPLIVIIILYMLSGSMSTLFICILGYVIGLAVCGYLYKGKECKRVIICFDVVFCVYLILSLIHYHDIMINYNHFLLYGLDEAHFWSSSQEACTKTYGYIINSDLIQNVYLENRLFYFYIQILALTATLFLDGNNVLYQLLGEVIPSTYICIFLYGIIKKICGKCAIKDVYLFMFLTCLLPISIVIHRDNLVALMYALAIYIYFCSPTTIVNFVKLAIIAVITFFLREQSGLFLLSLIILFLLFNYGKDKFFLLPLVTIALITLIPYAYYIFDNLNTTIEVYGGGKEELMQYGGGLSAYAKRLPWGLEYVAYVFQGQFFPIPVWARLIGQTSFFGILIGLWWIPIAIYWFTCFIYTTCYGIKYWNRMPIKYTIALFLFLFFLILNATNADPRRMVCMYPICFALYLYLKKYIVDRKKTTLFIQYVYLFDVLLMFLIFMMKG